MPYMLRTYALDALYLGLRMPYIYALGALYVVELCVDALCALHICAFNPLQYALHLCANPLHRADKKTPPPKKKSVCLTYMPHTSGGGGRGKTLGV